MKTDLKRALVLILCGALILGGVSLTALAAPSSGENPDPEPSESVPAPAPAAERPAGEAVTAGVTKDETVYVMAGADGSVEKLIVSDWLKNAGGAASIRDRSELTGIENVKGDETWTAVGDSLTWDAQGNDIYYQGTIQRDLPVEMTVTYKLDGKTVTPAELAGKSGRVTIRFDYTNKASESMDVDGKQETIFVPFAVLTGAVLDNEVFTNVEVTNGRLINDGDRTAVVGVAFPGLRESLGLDAETLDLPDYVEIAADAENFALETTITVAANEPFRELELDDLDSLGDLAGSMDEMTDAMAQLMDGAGQLYDGLSALAEKSGALSDGVGQLQSGAAQLASGLNTLAANNASLNGGARQVFDTLLSTANTQLAAAGLEVPALTVENYASVLTGVISSLDGDAVYQKALAQVTAAVEEQRPYIEEQVTAAVREQVTAQVTAAVREQVAAQVTAAVREQVAEQVISAAAGMDRASYDAAVAGGLIGEATQSAVESAIEEQMGSETVTRTIQAKTEEQMASGDVQTLIAANTEEQMGGDTVKGLIASNTEAQVQKVIADNMASDQVQAQLAAASEGAKSVIGLKTSLDSYNAFYTGLQTYTAGVAQAASGAGELKSGADQLNAAVPALIDGVGQLKDGAKELSDGLTQFNEEAIQKLADAVDGDLAGLTSRLQAVKDAAGDYQSFAGLEDGMDGQVKFIYRTDSIGTP